MDFAREAENHILRLTACAQCENFAAFSAKFKFDNHELWPVDHDAESCSDDD